MTISAKKISGKVLQRLRSGRGLVQEEIAERLGKARSSLAGWEAGRGGLNLENLTAFLDELGVTMEEFGRHFDTLRREGTTSSGEAARWAVRSGRGAVSDGSGPVVLEANHALIMVLGEQREAQDPGQKMASDEQFLRPWVQDLFKRAERLFPSPEELPETAAVEEIEPGWDAEKKAMER